MYNQPDNALPQNQAPRQLSPSPEPNEVQRQRAPSPGTPRISGSPGSTTTPPRLYSPRPQPPAPSPTPPPRMVWNHLVEQFVTEEQDYQITSEEIDFNDCHIESWETNFNLDFVRRNVRTLAFNPAAYPLRDIWSIHENWRSKFDKYVLRQPRIERPIFPDEKPQPLWEFIQSLKARILEIAEVETRFSLQELKYSGILLKATPAENTRTRLNRFSRICNIEFQQFQLEDVFEDHDALFDYVTKIVATVVLEARAVVFLFGAEGELFHHSGRVGGNSLIRQQCACHLIVSYNQYIHHRAQSGYQDKFGWAQSIHRYSNIGTSLCTLCKYNKFIEGYAFKIDELHDDDLYDGCVCESLVHPPADII
jgi:hypothetical protein